MPVVPADVLIHIASARADICFALSQSFFEGIRDQVEVLDERVCFRYFDGRDITGFIDGTENPQFPDDRAEVALLGEDAGIFQDGSFILHSVMRITWINGKTQSRFSRTSDGSYQT